VEGIRKKKYGRNAKATKAAPDDGPDYMGWMNSMAAKYQLQLLYSFVTTWYEKQCNSE
jgi:hypothetical protein